MACPDLNVLASLAEGGGSPQAREHLAACPVCREEVEGIRVELGEDVSQEADPGSLGLWKALAGGFGARRRQAVLPWAAAAAVLLVAGAWALSRRGGEASAVSVPASSFPVWLVEEGRPWTPSRDLQSFVLEGGIPGAAGKGVRLRLDAGKLDVEAGEILVKIPEGMTLVLAPDLSLPSGEAWIGADPGRRSAGILLREARADEPASWRVWIASRKSFLELRQGRWTPVEGDEPEGVRRLRPALPAPGPASREGVISVRLRRPSESTEVLLAFPQPGGSRAWLLGDWGSRGYPETATFSVAYGPWGARGSVEGRRVWALDAARAAALPKPPAAVGTGISARGGAVEVLRTETWGVLE